MNALATHHNHENGLYYAICMQTHECFVFDNEADQAVFIDAWFTPMRTAALFAYQCAFKREWEL
jgi:hypothetical protein